MTTETQPIREKKTTRLGRKRYRFLTPDKTYPFLNIIPVVIKNNVQL
jgi:hypothetical protein